MTQGRPSAMAVLLLTIALPAAAQRGGGPPIVMDSTRARQLYVSTRPEDHPRANYERDMADKARTDSIFESRSAGELDYRKITYRSRVGDLNIPAYVFQPVEKRGARGHAALIWVHDGVHNDLNAYYFPFIREAVERGYVVIAPEYRGSTGYGEAFHNAIDYGGREVDDVDTAYDWLADNLPHVDPQRVGIIGWSHGGYITLLSVLKEEHPYRAAAAIVPVTNLIFRLSYKGPGYQRSFATQPGIGGLPFEERETYIARSPYYHVEKLGIPLLVHVTTNDSDVNFEEASMLIWALRAQKPDLAETVIYQDPRGGHNFSRIVDRQTLERQDTPEMRDSWNRTWTFLEWNLRPWQPGPGG